MLATSVSANRFPGTVPALLAWVDGDTERLADLVQNFCAEAPALVQSLSRAVTARNPQEVHRSAHRLYQTLAHFGVPQLLTAAATLEDIGRSNDLGPAAPLIDELEATLNRFCAYLAKKPWLHC